MPRLSVPLTNQQHKAIRARAQVRGISLAEVMRRLLFLWLVEDLELPQDADYLALMDAMADYYAGQTNG